MASLWQYPFVNVFKHYSVGDWKKSSKEGDVTTVMDKAIKGTVYRISGVIPANNFIQLPKTSTQSLGLTGRYFYLLFKPIPERYFVVHIDVASMDGLVIRISFSNLFKEFKSTSTWLQFPFMSDGPKAPEYKDSKLDAAGPASAATTKWSILCLDLHYMLSIYLNRTYSYVKSFRLCANILVKGVFTSENIYEPGMTTEESKRVTSKGVLPLPKEMSYPVRRTEEWHDRYDFIVFPSSGPQSLSDCAAATITDIGGNDAEAPSSRPPGVIGSIKMSPNRHTRAGVLTEAEPFVSDDRDEKVSGTDYSYLPKESTESYKSRRILKDHNSCNQELPDRSNRAASKRAAPSKPSLTKHDTAPQKDLDTGSCLGLAITEERPRSHLPDPVLKLKRIIGFGGRTYGQVQWLPTSDTLVYPCHAIIVALHVATGKQRFFVGHTDKICCLSMPHSGTMIASGQVGEMCLVRIWNYETSECACLVRVSARSLHCLSFSKEGGVLCGVGTDTHDHTVVITWNTSRVLKYGEVSILAKAHTDFSISAMRVCPFDEYKMLSCGRGNLRMWRLKGTSLRSAPVSLDSCCDDEFTDICWSEPTGVQKRGATNTPLEQSAANSKAFTCTRSGYVYEIDSAKVAIVSSHRLLPARRDHNQEKQTLSSGAGITVNSIYANATFCITGSDDGFLRIWPLDFKHVYLEAEHDGPVTVVQMSGSGLQVVAGTATGSIGILDLSTRNYTTVMRSHTDRVLSLSLDPWRQHVATISVDSSIRVWDLKTGQQLYDFSAPKECPTTLTYHPSHQSLACGFSSGFIRVFDIAPTSVLAEHSHHKAAVTGITYSIDGDRLYSCDSTGLLCMYDATTPGYSLMRNVGNAVAKGIKFGPNALAVSPQGLFIAFVGPQEFSVTVVSSKTLDEVMKIDITLMSSTVELSRGITDAATGVVYSPATASHLLVTTSNNRLLKFDSTNGKLLEEVCDIHRGGCSAIEVTRDGQGLITAGDRCLKVWDYSTCTQKNFQVFIGHSDVISRVLLTPDSKELLSVGEAIFIWEYLRPVSDIDDLRSHRRRTLEVADTIAKRSGDSSGSLARTGFRSLADLSDQEAPDPQLPGRLLKPSALEQDATRSRELDISMPSFDRPSSRSSPVAEVIQGPLVHEEKLQKLALSGATAADAHRGTRGNRGGCSRSSGCGQPQVQKHFRARTKQGNFAQRRYTAPPGEAGLELAATFGYNGNGRKNVAWRPETGFFAYTCGCIVVVEDLKSGTQKHLIGHAEEISTITLQCDGLELATASGSHGLTKGQICIWDIDKMSCKRILSYHENDVVAMAYSRDDRFLVTIGDYRDPCVAVWSMVTYSVLATAQAAAPLHDVLWDPFMMNEFCTVGDSPAAVLFWIVDEGQGRGSVTASDDATAATPKLRVHDALVPSDDELLASDKSQVSFTSLCYAGDSVLYAGTSGGAITAWDTRHNKCFLHWSADISEISILVARRGRLISGALGSKSLRLWNVSGVSEMTLPADEVLPALPRSVSMDDEMLLDAGIVAACFDETLDMGIVGTTSGTLCYVNWSDRSSVQIVTTNVSNITAVEICNANQYVTCADDGSLRLWSVDEREQLLQFQVLGQSCLCVALVPPTRKESGVIKRQSIQEKNCVDSSTVAAGYSDGTIRVFDLLQADMVMKVQPHKHAITAVCFTSPTHMLTGDDGGYIATTSMLTGMTTRVISDHKMAQICSFDVSPHEPSSDSGTSVLWLAASADRRVSVWRADWQHDLCELVDWLTFPALPLEQPGGGADSRCTGGSAAAESKLELRAPPSIARFSPTDRDVIVYVGYGLRQCIQFYSLSSQQFVREIPLTQWARCIDLCPRGNLIAIGVTEHLLKLVDYNEGTFQDFVGHDDAVSAVKFSRDAGSFLLSVVDRAVLLWRVLL